MTGRTDIAVWGAEPIPGWVWDAIAGSRRRISAIGGVGNPPSAAAIGTPARIGDIRSFAAGTKGMTLLCSGAVPDADACVLADARELIITVEPWPASATLGSRVPRIALLPGFCQGSATAHAFDAASGAGGWMHAFVRADAPREFGSLLARTADAARMVLMHAGMPDEVSCTMSGQGTLRLRDGHPDAASRACAACEGTLSCLMRFADGRTATLVACAQASTWRRTLELRGRASAVADDDGADSAPMRIAAETIASDGALERSQPSALACRTAALVEAICLSGLTRSWEEPARVEDILARSSRFADD